MLSRLLAILITCFCIVSVHADGISLNQSRVIYSQKDKGQIVQVRNDTDSPILVQTSILQEIEGNSVSNFIVTPPLFKVENRSEFSTRIVANDVTKLPNDRESIFYFKARAIPSSKKDEKDKKDKPSLVFVTAFIIKLIYRPESIKEPSNKDYENISLAKHAGKWQFENKTPYYITVVGLSIDGKVKKESLLLKPFSNHILNESINNISDVSWYYLNDFGVMTEKQVINTGKEVVKTPKPKVE